MNQITLSSDVLAKNTIQYLYKVPVAKTSSQPAAASNSYSMGSNAYVQAGVNKLTFTQTLLVAGHYTFQVEVNGILLPMQSSARNVVPADYSTANNILYYFNPMSQSYNVYGSNTINVDNFNSTLKLVYSLVD
jgi:hypothetical protein